ACNRALDPLKRGLLGVDAADDGGVSERNGGHRREEQDRKRCDAGGAGETASHELIPPWMVKTRPTVHRSAQEGELARGVSLWGLDPEEINAARRLGPIRDRTVPPSPASTHRRMSLEQSTDEPSARVEDSNADLAPLTDLEADGRVADRGVSGEKLGEERIAGGPARIPAAVGRAG